MNGLTFNGEVSFTCDISDRDMVLMAVRERYARKLHKSERAFVLRGEILLPHIGKAWGRHVFRLEQGGRDCRLWLRDLPLSVYDLESMGFPEARLARKAEYARIGKNEPE